MKRMADVLLTYGWCRSSYSALRGLAQQGLRVLVTDTGRIGMCQASRLAHARARYRSPFADPQGFVAEIDTLCREYDVTMILAGHEEVELLALAREQGRLTAPAALPVARAATIEMANDKYRMACLAREQGVPVDSFGVGSSLVRGAYHYTADLVRVEGRPSAKAGREDRPNPRLERVE